MRHPSGTLLSQNVQYDLSTTTKSGASSVTNHTTDDTLGQLECISLFTVCHIYQAINSNMTNH